ncbi:MAG: calcium/proton exchanger [Chloroflexi bacterium]|nr:calcium/proton exchanger [Chloroflexota bacterium]
MLDDEPDSKEELIGKPLKVLTRVSLGKWAFPYWLLILVPVSIGLSLIHFNPIVVSIVTMLAMIPITSLMAKSTRDLSLRSGTIVASLLNVTFGNAFELITGIFAIRAGLIEMVKASLIGSIVQNVLLVVGLSMVFGGFKYHEQTFNRQSTSVASTMLLIAVTGLSLPTLYSGLTRESPPAMNQAVAIILGVTYLLSLVFALFTHRHLFKTELGVTDQVGWRTKQALLVLLLSVVLAATESNILVDSVQPVIETTGLSQAFIGLVIIALMGNIPELMTAITFGIRDNITQSLEIGMNSAIQIALFAVPVLVFVSPLVGGELSLAFAPFQMAAMILAVMIINYIGSDGICNWLEGVQLVTVYALIAIAFYFI